MPQNRLLHQRAGHSVKVCALSDFEFRVWVQYLLSADDFGVLPMTAVAVQRDNDTLEARPGARIRRALQALVACGLLWTFTHQQKPYLYQPDWQDWQRVKWPGRTLHPCPPVGTVSAATHQLLQAHPGGRSVPAAKDARSTTDAPPAPQPSTAEELPKNSQSTSAVLPKYFRSSSEVLSPSRKP